MTSRNAGGSYRDPDVLASLRVICTGKNETPGDSSFYCLEQDGANFAESAMLGSGEKSELRRYFWDVVGAAGWWDVPMGRIAKER
jgi:hypothetical protein